MSATVKLKDDGSVEFCDSDGNPLPPALERAAKEQQGDMIREWLSKECDKINDEIEALLNLHLNTPSPDSSPKFLPNSFNGPRPTYPELKEIGFFIKLFPPLRKKILTENAAKLGTYQQALKRWEQDKLTFERAEVERVEDLERRRLSDPAMMDELLTQKLKAIGWPRETHVDFEIPDGGGTVYLDVDLPEIEDLPNERASLPCRGWRLSIKSLSELTLRQHYMMHVHAIGFRLIGEVFATLPGVRVVVLSAYSQRPDKATGKVNDEYLYSVKVDREHWTEIDFYNLVKVDIVEALARFEIRRKMTKSGIFSPIEPFGLSVR